MPCLWDQADVDMLCMPTAEMLQLRALYKGMPDDDAPVDDGDEDPSPKIVPVVGAYYLIRPTKNSGVRFDVGQCKQIEDRDGHPACRILYWDPADKNDKDLFTARVPRTKYQQFSQLDLEFAATLEEKLRPLTGGGYAKHVHKHDRDSMVRFWIDRWEDDHNDLGQWPSDKDGD